MRSEAGRRERVLILGAAGRDFHDFNLVYRDDASVEGVAFTATQISGVDGRRVVDTRTSGWRSWVPRVTSGTVRRT
jgi:predicted GTPase